MNSTFSNALIFLSSPVLTSLHRDNDAGVDFKQSGLEGVQTIEAFHNLH